jgi:hypothetical protein
MVQRRELCIVIAADRASLINLAWLNIDGICRGYRLCDVSSLVLNGRGDL